jgi:hypothetical protein
MIPDGDLLRSRVVTELGSPLENALDRRLDGYAVLAPRETLLGDSEGSGVLTFESGIPTLAYHAGTERGGPPALADMGTGPFRLELYALDAERLEVPHAAGDLRIPPGMVAERLVGDSALADRTRALASTDRDTDCGALEAFLDDEAAIEALRESAHEEAERRAKRWGFEDAISDGATSRW